MSAGPSVTGKEVLEWSHAGQSPAVQVPAKVGKDASKEGGSLDGPERPRLEGDASCRTRSRDERLKAASTQGLY